MTPARLMRAIEDGIRPLCVDGGGALDVSESPEETIEMLKTGPNNWRLILQYDGFDKIDDYGSAIEERIHFVIQMKRGLMRARGQLIHREHNGRLPVLDLVGEVIRWGRDLRFYTTDEETGAMLNAGDVDYWGLIPENGQWLTPDDEGDGRGSRNFDVVFSVGTAWDGVPRDLLLETGFRFQAEDGTRIQAESDFD